MGGVVDGVDRAGGVVDGLGGAVPSSPSSSLLSYVTNGTDSLKVLNVKRGSGSPLIIRNSITGKTITFNLDNGSRREYSFKIAYRALETVAEHEGLTLYYLSFTLNSESSSSLTAELSKIRNTIQHRFERADMPFYYIWVIELQKKRYHNHGVKAYHWHMIAAVPKGTLPDIEYIQNARIHYVVKSQGTLISSSELYRLWGKGITFSSLAWNGAKSYLSKYLSKDLDDGLDWDDSRKHRWGSSRFGYLVWPEWAKQEVISLESRGADLSGFRVVRTPGSIKFLEQCVTAQYDFIGYDSRGSPMIKQRYGVGGYSIDEDGLLHYSREVVLLRSPWKQVFNVK